MSPSQRLAEVLCLSGRPDNDPPKLFLNICPHESDVKHCYGLTVLLQVRRFSHSANCLKRRVSVAEGRGLVVALEILV